MSLKYTRQFTYLFINGYTEFLIKYTLKKESIFILQSYMIYKIVLYNPLVNVYLFCKWDTHTKLMYQSILKNTGDCMVCNST